MNQAPTEPAYGRVAKALHWLVACLLGVQYVIGWTMPDVERHTPPTGLIGVHVALGTLIVLAVAARILWRLFNRPAASDALPATPLWSRRLASLVHGALYVLMVIVPLLGWAHANAHGWVVGITDQLSLPALLGEGSALGYELGDLHGALAMMLFCLIGLHVAAGVYHHIVLRDGTLRKMW